MLTESSGRHWKALNKGTQWTIWPSLAHWNSALVLSQESRPGMVLFFSFLFFSLLPRVHISLGDQGQDFGLVTFSTSPINYNDPSNWNSGRMMGLRRGKGRHSLCWGLGVFRRKHQVTPRSEESSVPWPLNVQHRQPRIFGTTLCFLLVQKVSSSEVFCLGQSLWIEFSSEASLKTRAIFREQMQQPRSKGRFYSESS